MTDEQQLKLQAFLDGELPEDEAREVAVEAARDAGAAALLKELRHTREAFKRSAPEVTLPESREFYWSKIARGIERLDTPRLVAAPRRSVMQMIQRFLLPIGASAVVALALIIGGLQLRPATESEMTVADSGAFTYQDFRSGTTLVWVSYPAESEFANNGSRR
jgi:anti-sigma factor RsiW